jgi:hypothetical protein
MRSKRLEADRWDERRWKGQAFQEKFILSCLLAFNKPKRKEELSS